ncbi:T9SS type A sorting domain-containing protein [Crocinitomix catalasitica]|nr:T9SS type A sorting domain-containing protein [Crocinitomix catalasitica]
MLSVNVQGQYYVNELYDVETAPEVYTSVVFNENDNTFLIHGSLTADHRPCVLRIDETGTSIDTFLVESDHVGATYSVGQHESIIVDHSNNILIVGYLSLGGGTYNGFVVKLNSVGDTIWTGEFGGIGKSDNFTAIIETTDSCYILTGSTETLAGSGQTDMWIMKLDTNGNILWQNNFGSSGMDRCLNVDTTLDGGFILGGYTDSYGAGANDMYIVRTDVDGNFLWHKWYGMEDYDSGFIKSLPTGEYLLYGAWSYVNPSNPSEEANHGVAMKLDANGDQIWFKEYATCGESSIYYYQNPEGINSVALVGDGYVYSGGTVDSLDGIHYGWIIKTDFSGNVQWQRRHKQRDNANYLNDIIELPGGDLAFTGWVWPTNASETSDGWLMRTNCLGFDDYPLAAGIFQNAASNTIILQNQSQRFGDGIVYWGDGWSYAFTEFDDTLISHTYATGGVYTAMLVVNACYHSDTLVWNVSATMTGIPDEETVKFSLFPNPANNMVTINFHMELSNEATLSFCDLNGRLIYEEALNDMQSISIDLSNFPNGIYFVRLSSSEGTLVRKLSVDH